MLENVTRNLATWDRDYSWPEDGDEWDGQAKSCGVPYSQWKESLVQCLLVPHIKDQEHVLEIGPGHGRWTEFLVGLAGRVTIVDISANCLDFCRRRFRAYSNVDYVLTTGDRLPGVAMDGVNFVWSYDAFVHMDRNVVGAYLGEIRRVLKIGGSAIIHHSNVDNPDDHKQDEAAGWRSAMNAELIRELAEKADLRVSSQSAYWDEERKIGSPRHGDQISKFIKIAAGASL
jgi:ubiquinone/menaquinone biosynthesis C-methylase UbiE